MAGSNPAEGGSIPSAPINKRIYKVFFSLEFMKKGLVILLFGLFFLQLISASVTITGKDINQEYIVGEKITGTITVSISEEDLDSEITSNLGTSTTLKEFLESNYKFDYCETTNCESAYSFSNPEPTKTINLLSGENKTVGLVLMGPTISAFDPITFSMNSDFSEGPLVPLEIKYLEEESWKHSNYSGTYSGSISNYNPHSSTFETSLLSTASLCQSFSLTRTGSLNVSVDMVGTFSNLEISVYEDLANEPLAQCYDGTGCILSRPQEESFESGEYFVCVKKDRGEAIINTENMSNKKTGIIYSDSGQTTSQNLNYGILVKPENYEDFSHLNTQNFLDNFNDKREDYLSEIYENSCTNGCIFPLTFSGVPQEINLSGLSIDYVSGTQQTKETNFYDLSIEKAKVEFSGTLDLSELNLIVGTDENFKLYVGGNEILNENLNITINKLKDIYPKEIPAGIPINFSLILNGNNSENLTYNWDFGDGTNLTTTNRWVEHTYLEIKNYSLLVSLGGNNITETRTFQIITNSPNEAILLTLDNKKETISGLLNKSNNYFFSNKLKELLNLVSLNNQLNNIARDYQNSSTEEDLIVISRALFSISIPTHFTVDEIEDFLIPETSSINVANIAQISGETANSSRIGDYQASIERWFSSEIIVLVKSFIVNADFESENSKELMKGYELSIESKSDDVAYIVINAPLNSLFFDQGSSPKSVGESTYITLQPLESKTIRFSRLGTNNLEIFAAPRLASLILDETNLIINKECNFNGICEIGENSSSCRDDCKPFGLIIGIVVLISFLFVVFLIGLSLWYQRHKEEILFGDRRQLFNLVTFIKNMKTKNMENDKIRSLLVKKGWVKERIDYAFLKENKIGKLNISSFNDFIDKKIYDKDGITQTKQQTSPNINKPNIQGMDRNK